MSLLRCPCPTPSDSRTPVTGPAVWSHVRDAGTSGTVRVLPAPLDHAVHSCWLPPPAPPTFSASFLPPPPGCYFCSALTCP